VYRWSKVQQWTISNDVVHEPLVSEADFIAAQAMHSTATSTVHEFAMTGLFSCEPCGRRPEPHWSHGRPAHRCRHGRTSSRHRWQRPVKNIYAREDQAAVFLARADITLADLPTILDVHQVVIWCDHDLWRLEIDGNTVIEHAPPRMTPIPKQRTPGLSAETPPKNQAASMEAVGKQRVRMLIDAYRTPASRAGPWHPCTAGLCGSCSSSSCAAGSAPTGGRVARRRRGGAGVVRWRPARTVRVDAEDMDERIGLFELANTYYDTQPAIWVRCHWNRGGDLPIAHVLAALDQMDPSFGHP
jgi:hypothetical protein